MNLEQYYYLAEIVGVVVVVGSLLLVAQQLRQNTKAIHITISQSYLDKFLDTLRDVMLNEDIAELAMRYSDDPKDYTPLELYRKGAWANMGMRQTEFMYLQRQQGNLNEDLWNSWYGATKAVHTIDPFARWFYEHNRQPFAPAFYEMMDSMYTQIDAERASD